MAPHSNKISVIGAGQIGGLIGLLAGQKKLGDLVYFDVVPKMPCGKALDQQQLSAIQKFDCKFVGTNDYAQIEGSDVVIVVAGVPRKPGMSRDDLVGINSTIIRDVGSNIKLHCPDAFVICLTNPLDVMVQILYEVSGVPSHMIVGMAGILDTARFKMFLAEKLNVSITDVNSLVLGGHGDTMVPLPRLTNVSGIPLADFISSGAITQTEVNEIVNRTRNGGAEVLNLLVTGSAYHAPAAAAVEMAEAFLLNQKRVLPCAAYLKGQYGITGHFIGVPIVLGNGGVEKIIELNLLPDERKLFDESARAVMDLQKIVPK